MGSGVDPIFLIALFVAIGSSTVSALRVEVLRSTGGLPPHIVGLFEEPLGFQQVPGGPYYVFEIGRAHV